MWWGVPLAAIPGEVRVDAELLYVARCGGRWRGYQRRHTGRRQRRQGVREPTSGLAVGRGGCDSWRLGGRDTHIADIRIGRPRDRATGEHLNAVLARADRANVEQKQVAGRAKARRAERAANV